jgi:hypothetical protein
MSSVRSVQQPTEAMLETFERVYRSGVPFQEDRVLGTDLVHEVAPVLETLARTAANQGVTGSHEAYALLSLLGRRAGWLGATPSAAFVVLRALVTALSSAGLEPSAEFREQLNMVLIEGYCAGRDERVSSELRASVARSQVSISLAPRCRYLAPAGPLEVEALEQVLDEAARAFLRDDGVSCLLDVARLESQPTERVARALLEFCLQCRSVGGSLVLTGVSPELTVELRTLGLSNDVALVVHTLAEAMSQVLALAGHELRPLRAGWAKALFTKRWHIVGTR